MTQGNHINHALAFVLHITEDIQLLSFSFRGEFGFARMPGWMRKFSGSNVLRISFAVIANGLILLYSIRLQSS